LSVIAALRKGFGFFLMSMGVSTYAKKPGAKAAAPNPAEGESRKQPQ
jgi:hypothetical protein